MTYGELLQAVYEAGYMRVERDDRLLDVFPKESRVKGVELWERWDKEVVKILKIRMPFVVKKMELYEIPRKKLEKLLMKNIVAELEVFNLIAQKEEVWGRV